MDDLLKEAIADAKAVRETALENAKIALEEAFTPRLQSMLSKKIQSEIEAEGAHEDDEDVEEARHDDEEVDEKMRLKADDEAPTDDASEGAHEDDEDVEERMHGEEEDDDVEERMHDEEEDEKKDEAMHDEEEDDDVDEELDLESVLKELEASIEEDEEVEEGAHEEDEEDKVDENDVSSEIGAADNKLNKKAIDSTDIGKANKAKFESKEQVEEEIDLDEVLKALTEEDEEEAVEEVNEVSKLQAELDEHRDVVKYLRGKLNEVNLLNAKLLFTNKLFRGFGLSNDQKMKVVETFDRATNLREVKLVYSTLVESFKTNQPEKIKESKGSASKPVASTKSEKQEIISEGSELRDRFKKLAGITKFNSYHISFGEI